MLPDRTWYINWIPLPGALECWLSPPHAADTNNLELDRGNQLKHAKRIPGNGRLPPFSVAFNQTTLPTTQKGAAHWAPGPQRILGLTPPRLGESKRRRGRLVVLPDLSDLVQALGLRMLFPEPLLLFQFGLSRRLGAVADNPKKKNEDKQNISIHGRNPAPVGMSETPIITGIVRLPTGAGFCPCTVWACLPLGNLQKVLVSCWHPVPLETGARKKKRKSAPILQRGKKGKP